MCQPARFGRWQKVRDSVWRLVRAKLTPNSRVAIVGAGSCDDIPLMRISRHAACIDLIDFDHTAVDRALKRAKYASHITPEIVDVTEGCADRILDAIAKGKSLPNALALPHKPFSGAPYDLIIGDMLYTQLLHPGLLKLDVEGPKQHMLMRRYDPHLTRSLVLRIQRSLATGGYAMHIHDVACWTNNQPQPIPLERALTTPDLTYKSLNRHDRCDPHLILPMLNAEIIEHAWWSWPFEPNKSFLVRASVATNPPSFPSAHTN